MIYKSKIGAIFKDIDTCFKCHIATEKKIYHKGDLKPEVLFVGEAPGKEEMVQGIPFVGRSGKLLQEFIDTYVKRSYAVTNICKCRPPDNRPPTKDEIKNCSPFLKRQIEEYDPRVIIPLGKSAYSFFKETKKDFLLKAYNLDMWEDKILIPMPHPSYFLRRGYSPNKKPIPRPPEIVMVIIE